MDLASGFKFKVDLVLLFESSVCEEVRMIVKDSTIFLNSLNSRLVLVIYTAGPIY